MNTTDCFFFKILKWRINLYYKNQMHKNYKVDEQVISNVIHRHIKPTEPQKQIKFIIYYTKFKISNIIVKNNKLQPLTQTNVVYKFTCLFRECFSDNNITPYTYIRHTTTTLSRRFTYYFSDTNPIKQDIKQSIAKTLTNSNPRI